MAKPRGVFALRQKTARRCRRMRKDTVMKSHSFLRDNPLAYLAVPLAFVAITAVLAVLAFRVYAAPYEVLVSWFAHNTASRQSQDLFAGIENTIQTGQTGAAAADAEAAQPATIPLSSITYPANGDRYGEITIAGTAVSAPLYYGDSNAILNQGVGTYKDSSGAGIPGEGKTVLLAGHNNTFFNDLQQVETGNLVTIRTHYGTYTYEVTETKKADFQDTTTYDFTRTDENLILYTCYPFDALGFTPDRYFVYAKFVSGPKLDANS